MQACQQRPAAGHGDCFGRPGCGRDGWWAPPAWSTTSSPRVAPVTGRDLQKFPADARREQPPRGEFYVQPGWRSSFWHVHRAEHRPQPRHHSGQPCLHGADHSVAHCRRGSALPVASPSKRRRICHWSSALAHCPRRWTFLRSEPSVRRLGQASIRCRHRRLRLAASRSWWSSSSSTTN